MFLFIFDYFMIECFVVFSSNCIETKIKYFLEYGFLFFSDVDHSSRKIT